jgi:crossover junction endodeoxyribonuclease RusA
MSQTNEQWEIVLPFTRALSLNDRMHHMVKAKTVALWRKAAKEGLLSVPVPACERVRAEFIYIPAQKRRRDPDNLVAAMKPVVDALVDAGVVPDDTQEYVERVWPIITDPDPNREDFRFVLRVTKLA